MSSTIFGALQDQATNAYQHMSSVFSSASSHAYTLIPSVPDYGAASFSTNPVLPPDATKIEPKVFLASERTFLTWLRVAVLISTFALALFNSAAPGDWVAKGMGFTYATVAIGVIGYAWVMHEKRRTRIIGRYAGHHDEVYGPVLLCIAIFLAVLVNFILRVQQRERLAGVPSPKNPWVTINQLLQTAFTLPARV